MPRDSLMVWLVALPAALMLAAGSAAALPLMSVLCNGGTAGLPAKPAGSDCDKACHAGCQRRRGKL